MAFTRDGRFKIGRQLGSGAFGVVFEAFDTLQSRNVAIKLLSRISGDTLIAFKREFRSLAGLRHRNLVSRYELLSDGKVWFFTMELVDGLELLEYLARNELSRSLRVNTAGPTTPRSIDASDIPDEAPPEPREQNPPPVLTTHYLRDLRVTLKQLIDGISALHDSGHVHRDIKPSNVLVTTEGRVVIVDFGLAVALEEPTNGFDGGTPGYMSPEQAAGLPLTPASDWFSVGVLLYVALTGRLPWETDHLGRAKWNEAPPAPSTLVAGVPADLNDLCLRLIAPDPAERPAKDEIRRRAAADSLNYSLPAVRSNTLGQPAFVGRSAERAAMHAALDRARGGELTTVAVHGEPGIGKTSLVNAFFDEVRERFGNVLILAGHCSAREWVAYNALDVVMERLASALQRLPSSELMELLPNDIPDAARLFPVLESVPAVRRQMLSAPDGEPDAAAAANALRGLLRGLCARSPVILLIDDAQWGDLDTARLLELILAPPDPPPLLLVTAWTNEDAATGLLLRTLDEKLRNVDVELGPLTSDEADELARAVLLQWPSVRSSSRTIVRESGGNPFLVDFLARYRKRQPRSARLRDAIHDQIAKLEPEARALVRAIAVAGEPLELSLAYDVAGVTTRAFEALSALRERRLARSRITGALEEVEMYHRRVRDAIISQMDDDTVALINRRIAEELEGHEVIEPERLYRHYAAAGMPEKASHYAIVAADAASDALAYTRAASLLDAAAALSPAMETAPRVAPVAPRVKRVPSDDARPRV